jgi:large subunit ribosomal protein L17
MGFRIGDNAPMAYIQLMDRPDDSGDAVEIAD